MAFPCNLQKTTILMPHPALRAAMRANRDSAQPSAPAQSDPLRDPSFGDYELLEEVGRGAMGVVYKARQRKVDRIVALKLMLPAADEWSDSVERLRSEAQAAGRLDHPGIVPIHDVGEYRGRHYICMAFVDGESLADRIERGRLRPAEAARILAEVAEAIQHTHDRGIVHCDVKPANILLDRSSRARIVDFGLARMLDSEGDLIDASSIAGTPWYMSPEQASGHSGSVGPASDIYSMGAVLYQLLTGRTTFGTMRTMAVLRKVREERPVSPRCIDPSIPAALEAICLRCLEKDPADRFTSAGELAGELRAWLAREAVSIETPPRKSPIERSGIRSRKQLLGACLRMAASLPAWLWAVR